jgi:hypothetical protein
MKKSKLFDINKEQPSGFSQLWGATISFAGSAVSDGRSPGTDKDMVNLENPEVSGLPNRFSPEIAL